MIVLCAIFVKASAITLAWIAVWFSKIIGGAEVNEISRRLMNWHLHHAHETNCLFLASVIWLSGSVPSLDEIRFRFVCSLNFLSLWPSEGNQNVWNFQGCIAVYLSRYHTIRNRIVYKLLRNLHLAFLPNGEGGIWTLAPLLTTCTLSRGVPSTSWVLLQVESNIHYILKPIGSSSQTLNSLTERVGFEPTRPCGQTVFKTASLWPLRYLSMNPLISGKNYSTKNSIMCQLVFSKKEKKLKTQKACGTLAPQAMIFGVL